MAKEKRKTWQCKACAAAKEADTSSNATMDVALRRLEMDAYEQALADIAHQLDGRPLLDVNDAVGRTRGAVEDAAPHVVAAGVHSSAVL